MRKRLHPYQERVLEQLRKVGGAGAPPLFIAHTLGTSRQAVNQTVYELRKLGYRIVRVNALVLKKEIEDEDQDQ